MNWSELLDDSKPFDESRIVLLESALNSLNVKEAQIVLANLQQHPDAWKLIEQIFIYSQSDSVRIYGLSLVRKTINTRFCSLTHAEKSSLRSYFSALWQNACAHNNCSLPLLLKIDEVTVDLAKQMYPSEWPEFIAELIHTDGNMTQNFVSNKVQILRLFVEDVIEHARTDLISDRAKEIHSALRTNLPGITSFIMGFLATYSSNDVLCSKALEVLAYLIRLGNIKYVVESGICEKVVKPCWANPLLRVTCLDVLTEVFELIDAYIRPFIGNTSSRVPDGSDLFVVHNAFLMLLELLAEVPETAWTYIESVPADKRHMWEEFFLRLVSAVTVLNRNCFNYLYVRDASEIVVYLMNSGQEKYNARLNWTFSASKTRNAIIDYLLKLSSLNEPETLRLMAEFWAIFLPQLQVYATNAELAGDSSFKNDILGPWNTNISNLMEITLDNMIKPPEVFINFDEDTGCCRRDSRALDNDELALYKHMKVIVCALTRLNSSLTQAAYDRRLVRISQAIKDDRGNSPFNISTLNKLCWTAGSAVGVLSPRAETDFFVRLIRQLLEHCSAKKGKESKSVIASMIMYVVGQFPRCSRADPNLLRAVVTKNIEFIADNFPGIHEMAVETLFKLSTSCGKEIFNINDSAFIQQLIGNIPSLSGGIQTRKYLLLFYKSLAEVLFRGCSVKYSKAIASAGPIIIQLTSPVIEQFVASHNMLSMVACSNNWQDPAVPNLISVLRLSLQIGLKFCESLKEFYIVHAFYPTYDAVISLYRCISTALSNPQILPSFVYRELTALREDWFILLGCFVSTMTRLTKSESDDYEKFKTMNRDAITFIVENVFKSYAANPASRDPEVISLARETINVVAKHDVALMGQILQNVFLPSLDMIGEQYKDHQLYRLPMYTFVNSVINHSFEYLVENNHVSPFIACIMYGINDETPDTGRMALQTLYMVLQKVEQQPQLQIEFCQSMYYDIIDTIGRVFIDMNRLYGKFEQIKILHILARWNPNTPAATSLPSHQSAKFTHALAQSIIQVYPNASRDLVDRVLAKLVVSSTYSEFETYCLDLHVLSRQFGKAQC